MPQRSKAPLTNNSDAKTALTLMPKPGASKNEKTRTSSILDQQFNRSLEERIRERAYELYARRGYEDGRAERDWLEAELQILADR